MGFSVFQCVPDLNDVPGYTPVTKSTPIWKRDMIEKKNQEKIEEYIVSIDGLIPSALSPKFNPFPNKPWFLRVCCRSLLKTLLEKEKLLLKSNFSFSHSFFFLFGEFSDIFIKFKIVGCKLFQFGRV